MKSQKDKNKNKIIVCDIGVRTFQTCITNNSIVEIGDNVIIGANCLIHKSIPSNTIVKHMENLIIQQL